MLGILVIGLPQLSQYLKQGRTGQIFFLVLDSSVVGNHEPTIDRTQEFNLNNKLIEVNRRIRTTPEYDPDSKIIKLHLNLENRSFNF